MVVNPQPGRAWDLGAFRLRAECRSAHYPAGGDFIAFVSRGPNRLAVVIGDGCGRGSDGAQLIPYLLEPLEELLNNIPQPSALLGALNRRLVGRLKSDRFVTGAVLELDAEAGSLVVSNAGHVPAMLRNAAGEVALVGRASGPPLGIFDDCSYSDDSYAFGAGDVVVSITDGLLETVETDLSSMPRLMALVAQAPGNGQEVHRRLLATFPASSTTRRVDDMSLLSLEHL
jgi:two-component system, chemotaxis family, sensor kinase Cph1